MKLDRLWVDAIQKRCSRRTYKAKEISVVDIENINSLIQRINEESGLNFQFIKNGKDAFKGFKSSYGVLTGVNSFIALVGDKGIDNLDEKIGYYGEMIVLEATSMRLGTCWVGGTYNKSECINYIDIGENEDLRCIITIGYTEKEKSVKEKLICKLNKSKKDYKDILINYNTYTPDVIKQGIYFALKAPSELNKKPVGYEYKNNVVKVYNTKENHGYEKIDLGISMLHFELGVYSRGYKGKWFLNNGINEFKIDKQI